MPGVLDADMLGRLRDATDLLLDAQTEEQKARNRSQGSMFRFSQTADTVFAELIALPAALGALARLGFTEVTYTDAWTDSACYLVRRPDDRLQLTVEHRSAPAPDPLLLRLSGGGDQPLSLLVEPDVRRPGADRGSVVAPAELSPTSVPDLLR